MVFLFSTSSLCLWAARRPDTPQTARERGRAKNPMRAKRSILITIFLPDSRERPAASSPFTRPFGGTRGRSSIGRAAGDVSASHWRYVGRGKGARPAKRKRPMVLVRAQPPAPICGCSSMAERRLSKPNAWVQFPLSAPTPDGGISPIL